MSQKGTTPLQIDFLINHNEQEVAVDGLPTKGDKSMLPTTISSILELSELEWMQGSLDTRVTGVSIDTRTLQAGDLFVAFAGEKVDGHQYLDQARHLGASGAIVTNPEQVRQSPVAWSDFPILVTANPIHAIRQLAIRERNQFQGPVFAVTGSNGKTTTKEMMFAAYSPSVTCLATRGNLNNELGLPLTILQRTDAHGAMVLEMGMRARGQISNLCEIARPTAGMITNIGHSHLETLGSQQNIALAKGELLEHLSDRYAALIKEDPWLWKLGQRGGAKILWCSLQDGSAHAYFQNIEQHPRYIRGTVEILGHVSDFYLPSPGLHNAQNALLVLAIGVSEGYSLDSMVEGLKTYSAQEGRLHIIETKRGQTILDDCYNASPLSMKASLDVLVQVAGNRPKVAILGDMFELGDYAVTGHKEVGDYAVALGVQVMSVGSLAKYISGQYRASGKPVVHFDSVEGMLHDLPNLIPDEATVLVKASRGMHLETIVRALVEQR
jgi:UDP-N-acetylmuramoyl-tripeptide--D-alanyl-D-alanine ligase